MELSKWLSGLVVLTSVLPSVEAAYMHMYDPRLCYILDGFLGLYGLIITGMFIKEKFFRTKQKKGEDSIYTGLEAHDSTYTPLRTDLEKGRNAARPDDTYTGLNKYGGDEYRELPVKRERQKKGEQLYQGLRSGTRDTYDELQMQPLPGR